MQLPLLTSPKAGSYFAPLFPATPRSSDFLNVIYDNKRQIGQLSASPSSEPLAEMNGAADE